MHIQLVIPRGVSDLKEEPEVPQPSTDAGVGFPGGSPNGVPNGVPYSLLPLNSQPPAPLPNPEAIRRQQIRVGGAVVAAKLIHQVKPDYPPLAKMTRTQGTVRLEAVIGTDGTIQNLRVLEGHPLLVKAALEAVSHWRYQPTLLNGAPVEVITEIVVNFALME